MSGDSSCVRKLKYFLVLFNFFTTITGGVLIGLGVYYKMEAAPYLEVLNDSYIGVPIFIIAIGAMLFIVGFMGCCSVMCEMKCLLKFYIAVIILLLILQIAGIAIFFTLRDIVTEGLIAVITKNTLPAFGGNNAKERLIEDSMILIQSSLECCGAANKSDWESMHWYPNGDTDNKVPGSCCPDSPPDKKACPLDEGYDIGCAPALYRWVDDKIMVIAPAIGVILLIQLLLALSGCGVTRYVGNRVVPM